MNNNKMEKFIKSGKISDYLDYKANKKSKNEETSMEFIHFCMSFCYYMAI